MMKICGFIFLALLLPSLVIARDNDNLIKKAEAKMEEVSPNGDLMREHGVLNRILLINDDDLKSNSQQLKNVLQQFTTMYRPHEAREDTVLFPEFKNLISEKEYEALGELFEEKEYVLFGEDGFKSTIDHCTICWNSRNCVWNFTCYWSFNEISHSAASHRYFGGNPNNQNSPLTA